MGSLKGGSISKIDIKSLLSATSASPDPPPRDFKHFINWVSRKFGIRDITVKRISKAQYQPVAVVAAKKHKNPLKTASVAPSQEDMGNKDSIATVASTKESLRGKSLADPVIISAYYDTNSVLEEIAFIDCLVPVPREVFMLIQLSLPYNPHLTRITWKGARLTSILVCELSKIIPGSQITDVIFDGCYVPQGNYYVLLDKASNLKYLSLSNCKINDEVCAMIAERIQLDRPAAGNLLVLNLSSNRITDIGAEALGRSLRTNRRLLYLNLCNNDITSVGAAHILTPLIRFMLSCDEISATRLLKLKAVEDKLASNVGCLKELTNLNVNYEQRQKLKEKKVQNETQMSDRDIYLATVKEEKEEKGWYSSGNLTLCALNLAYNRLDSATVSRLVDVVLYQLRERKSSMTGLLRVVIEGNPLPETCMEYDLISKYIDLAIEQTRRMQSTEANFTKSKSNERMSQLNNALSEPRMK